MFLAFFHGEQVLIGFLLAGIMALVGVPLGLYMWVWHTKMSERKLALAYLGLVILLCVIAGLFPNVPASVFALTVFSLALILTLPWSAVGGVMLGELSDRQFAVVMVLSAAVNTVILYFIAARMRRKTE